MIHNIYTTEFIAAVKDGSYNENDVQRYCNTQPSLMPLFKSLHKAASTLIASKGIQGGFIWNLTERRWDFDNAKDLHIYMDAEFTRLQDAMGIVCDLIEKHPLLEQKDPAKPQHGKYKSVELYITGNNKEAVIQAIKTLVSDTKGKHPAAVIFVAVSDGYMMSKPTFEILKEAFGIVGTKSAFNIAYSKYRDDKRNTYEEDINSARAALKRVLEGAF